MKALVVVAAMTFVSSPLVLACAEKPARDATMVRSSDCDDADRPAICPGDVDCSYDDRTGCQVCTCNSDEHKIDQLPTRDNLR